MSRNEDSPQRFNDDGSDADSDLEELQGDIAKFDESVREFLSSHHGTSKGSKPVRGGFKGGRGSRGPRKAAKPRGDITARLAKVNQAFLAGDYSQALDLVSEVIRINAETHQAWTALASIFREQGEPKRALAAMVYAAHLRDKDFSGWITCATYAMDTMEGEFDEENLKTARLCYSAALKADPTNLEARLAKAAICHRQGHYSQAILEYNLALKNHPADLDIVRKIAEACADNNHSDASVVSAIAAYRTFFDHTKASGAGDLTELWYDIGIYIDLFGARRHYEEGIQELRELSRWIAGRQNEQYWDSIQTDDREWDIDSIRRAEVPQFQNQYSDESKYGSFLPLDMRVRLAVYRFKLDSPTEAMKHMTLLNPDDEEIKYLIEDFPALAFDLAEELRRIENHGDAIKFYELLRALPGDPDPTTLLQLGRCYLATAEDPTAEECFLAAIEADPDIIDARFELAHMYEKVKENEEALILAAEAMALRDARSYAGMRSEAQGAAADTREYAGMPQGATTKQPATQQLPDHQVNVSQEQTTQVENVGDGVTNHNTFNFRRIMPAPPQDSHHPSRQPLLSTGSIGTPPQIPMYDANMPVDPALGGEIQALPQAGVTGALLSAAIPRLARIQELQSQSGASSRLWPSIPKRYRPKRLAGPAKRVQDEKDRALRLSRQYETVKQLKQQVEAGYSDLVPDWMNASRELIDEFRSLKRFYSWDKYLNFLGSSSADRPVQQPETELSQLYQRLARSTQAEQTNRERTNFPVDNDHGISFDDWLDVFIDYAIALAVEHRQQESYQICEAAKDSTVFQSEEHEFFIYVGWSVCAIYANDEETCVHTARQLMKDKSSSDGYRVFGLLSKLCQSPISWYTSGPAQKYILRQIKAMDSLHEPLFSENSIDMKPGRRRPSNVALDVCLLMLYGHILFTSTSYTYAIGYFLRARALDPENSMISLCLGLAYVHYGLKRQSTNRQYLLLQGHSFIGEYLEMDEGEGARPLAERQYNVGRLFQLLGLNSLSSEYYERAMQANEGEHKIKDIDVNIAVNNVVSSLAVGNKGHAMKVVKEQLIL